MANEQNLIPIRTTERARELGRLGGIKSGEVRRKRNKQRILMSLAISAILIDDMSIDEVKRQRRKLRRFKKKYGASNQDVIS